MRTPTRPFVNFNRNARSVASTRFGSWLGKGHAEVLAEEDIAGDEADLVGEGADDDSTSALEVDNAANASDATGEVEDDVGKEAVDIEPPQTEVLEPTEVGGADDTPVASDDGAGPDATPVPEIDESIEDASDGGTVADVDDAALLPEAGDVDDGMTAGDDGGGQPWVAPVVGPVCGDEIPCVKWQFTAYEGYDEEDLPEFLPTPFCNPPLGWSLIVRAPYTVALGLDGTILAGGVGYWEKKGQTVWRVHQLSPDGEPLVPIADDQWVLPVAPNPDCLTVLSDELFAYNNGLDGHKLHKFGSFGPVNGIAGNIGPRACPALGNAPYTLISSHYNIYVQDFSDPTYLGLLDAWGGEGIGAPDGPPAVDQDGWVWTVGSGIASTWIECEEYPCAKAQAGNYAPGGKVLGGLAITADGLPIAATQAGNVWGTPLAIMSSQGASARSP